MNDSGLALFETPIGTCGIAWRATGLVGLQLPDGRATLGRLQRRFSDLAAAAPPLWVQEAIDAVVALLSGKPAVTGIAMVVLSGPCAVVGGDQPLSCSN